LNVFLGSMFREPSCLTSSGFVNRLFTRNMI
jgi:hypothetical protein